MKPTLRERALRLLALRDYTRVELVRRLAPHGSEEEIEALLIQLENTGLLSDARAVESFVAARGARYGALKLRHELRRKGASEALIEGALETTPEEELARAREVWRRKFAAPPVDLRDYARQARFLQSRGFAPDIVRKLLREPVE